MAIRTRKEYESDMALLKKLKYDVQWNTEHIEYKHLSTSDGWNGARSKLGLSQREWDTQVGSIPYDTTHITCFFTLKDRIRRKFGLKPKDEIDILVR